jgi:ribosomal protein S18 acetylase RimI-like enzyme
VVVFRTFRNDDPPRLAALWNEAFTGRGAVRLRTSSPLERFVLAKPYFDRAGLILALEDGVPVGFAHAGFGANVDETALSYERGVVCAIGVRPTHRRRGIGRELIHRCESYLTQKGARAIYAGPLRPFNPFYLGLYGGSELPGFLASEPTAEPFFSRLGYEREDTCLVLQRVLHEPINIADARFPDIRRRCEVCIEPWTEAATWWQECVRGPVENVGFHLEEKDTGQVVARAAVWEMDGFTWRWNQPAVAIVDVEVPEDRRRQGFAKFTLCQMLRHLQDQYFGVAEVQTMRDNQAALSLYRGLGFTQVDEGHIYRKSP